MGVCLQDFFSSRATTNVADTDNQNISKNIYTSKRVVAHLLCKKRSNCPKKEDIFLGV
jgi:hypothetical protein